MTPRLPGPNARRHPTYAYHLAEENVLICPSCAARVRANLGTAPTRVYPERKTVPAGVRVTCAYCHTVTP
jgi:hypothetical protein